MSELGGRAARERTPVRVFVNGEERVGLAAPRLLLSDFLRSELGLTGTNIACEHGACGSCTVLLDGQAVLSCLVLAVQAEECVIETIEGVATASALHPIQEAFRAEHGLQCGFCTPGFVIATKALLEANPSPSDEEIRTHLGGNVCRCTGYVGIVAAVRRAAETLRAEPAGGPVP